MEADGPTTQPATDRVKLKPSEVLVIVISGHTQNGANDEDPKTAPHQPSDSAGVRFLAAELRKPEHGFTNLIEFSEDPGNKKKDTDWNVIDQQHCGETLVAILGEIDRQLRPSNLNKPKGIALIGYSHGGGLAWEVSRWIDDRNYPIDVVFSAYIDAVKNPVVEKPPGHPTPIPEERVPINSPYHVNYFQSKENPVALGLLPNGTKSVHLQQGIIKENKDLDDQKNIISHTSMGAHPGKNPAAGEARLGIILHIERALEER
jgi:hypothetical protein